MHVEPFSDVVLPKNLALGGDAAKWVKQVVQHLAILDGALLALVQNRPSSGVINHSTCDSTSKAVSS
jgi:hypothetical protein